LRGNSNKKIKKERGKMLSMTLIPVDHEEQSEAHMVLFDGSLTNSIAASIKKNVKESISECKTSLDSNHKYNGFSLHSF
jgi:hypothetical protein